MDGLIAFVGVISRSIPIPATSIDLCVSLGVCPRVHEVGQKIGDENADDKKSNHTKAPKLAPAGKEFGKKVRAHFASCGRNAFRVNPLNRGACGRTRNPCPLILTLRALTATNRNGIYPPRKGEQRWLQNSKFIRTRQASIVSA